MVETTSNLDVYWVKPILPTTLEDTSFLPVSGTDLILHGLDGLWLMPVLLDLEKLKTAIASTLSNYPHAAGRLSCNQTDKTWRIKLTNDAVPLTVSTSGLDITDDFLREDVRHPEVVEPLRKELFQPTSSESEPLVRLKLVTFLTGKTSLYVAFCHVLGDAHIFFNFVSSISRQYQGLNTFLVPTFEKYLQPVPTLNYKHLQSTLSFLPHLAGGSTYDSKAFETARASMLADTVRVHISFSAKDLEIIYGAVSPLADTKLTKQDALVGFLIAAVSKSSSHPIKVILNPIGYRGLMSVLGSDYAPPPLTSAGNNVVSVLSTGINTFTAVSYASNVRKTKKTALEPENIGRIVALSEELSTRSAEIQRVGWWKNYSDSVAYGDMHTLPVIDFGFTDQTTMWMFDDWERYLRIWPANPVQFADGSWEGYPGGVDVTTRLKSEVRDAFVATLQDELRSFRAVASRRFLSRL